MIQTNNTLTAAEASPTQHAMLIVWGHFARTIGLLERLADVPIPQKTVLRFPQEKVTEFLIGLLSGIEYLTDLSESAAPLVQDTEVARAWKLQPMADASGVSRTLRACNDQSVCRLQMALDTVSQPFLARAVADLRQHNEPLLLDADLTGRPISSTSRTFPGAAFGYMDGEVRLGYQLAEICLQTHLYGRQWLSAQHHPGNTVSSSCLLELVQNAERRLGCYPRRRTQWLQRRIDERNQAIARGESLAAQQDQQIAVQTQRVARLSAQIQRAQEQVQTLRVTPASTRQLGPYSKLNRLKKQITGWQRQCQHAQETLAKAATIAQHHRERISAHVAERNRLQARYEHLCRDNARQPQPPRCTIRIDAGFCSGENLSALIELGYDVETKSANATLVQTLRQRASAEQAWLPVGKNAEMMGWTNYHLRTCPYPLTVGLQRFHTPKGLLHAVLIRSQASSQALCPNLKEWFQDYNGRQSIEAGNKEEKTTFKVQHLMSRSPAGILIQAILTVFAANFVRWANEWIHPRVERSSKRFDRALSSPKRLVRIAANSPATIDRSNGGVLVRFSPLSSFDGVVIRLADITEHQLSLPLFANDHFSSFSAI